MDSGVEVGSGGSCGSLIRFWMYDRCSVEIGVDHIKQFAYLYPPTVV